MTSWTSRLSASLAPREPEPVKSQAEMLAEWRAAHHADLSPQQALASGVSLGPNETTDLRASNHPSKLHTEIKIDGKVVARIYNGGSVEMPNEYSLLSDELGFNNDTMVGPDLAENRAKRIKEALISHGAVLDDGSASAGFSTVKAPVLDMVRALTAQTQSERQAKMFKQPGDPGTYYSRTA
jgi:hypothetical protein